MSPDRRAHDVIAFYLTQIVIMNQAMLGPEQVNLRGGVLRAPGLNERVRAHAASLVRGYCRVSDDQYEAIVAAPTLSGRAAPLWAMEPARRALSASRG
ncbi:hypothetical protein CKY28_12815 [Sphingomonas lenta]|uniref:Uncharacterized protein n=2 Tax=Sphingomonas lenta TaxID=1141887 RepID=A0A2A2SCM0_9SPHN|nr:hypothetical protein CKY28_12815 [Sphingomonas lenta]